MIIFHTRHLGLEMVRTEGAVYRVWVVVVEEGGGGVYRGVVEGGVYCGQAPQARPGRMRATSREENRLTALLSRMGFPLMCRVVIDS